MTVVKLLFPLFLCTVLSPVMALDLNPERIPWKKLQFSASFLFVSATADVSWEPIDKQRVNKVLLPVDKGVPITEQPLFYMTLESRAFNRNSQVKFWFQQDATALQREQLDWGKRQRLKTYRFATDKAQAIQWTPLESEAELAPEKWSRKETFQFKYPKVARGIPITDNAALFYVISAANLRQVGDSLVIHSFGKQTVNKITIRVAAEVYLEVNYKKRTQSALRFVEEETTALELRLEIVPLGEEADEGFEFLGLKDDVRIYLEKSNLVPLRISGKVDYLGWTAVDMVEVEMR